jgi:hypothetical protein
MRIEVSDGARCRLRAHPLYFFNHYLPEPSACHSAPPYLHSTHPISSIFKPTVKLMFTILLENRRLYGGVHYILPMVKVSSSLVKWGPTCMYYGCSPVPSPSPKKKERKKRKGKGFRGLLYAKYTKGAASGIFCGSFRRRVSSNTPSIFPNSNHVAA